MKSVNVFEFRFAHPWMTSFSSEVMKYVRRQISLIMWLVFKRMMLAFYNLTLFCLARNITSDSINFKMLNNNRVKYFPISPQNYFPVKCRKFFKNANDSTSSLRKAVPAKGT